MSEGERVAVIDTKLLELMACPISKGPLVYDAARSELVSKRARLAYPVRDGIPIMLPSEARSLRDDPEAENR
ncbi:Trm112 family protein [Aquibium carbonis]|uniref:UPF0434 protein EJC49_02165 n=1 Tax=Aquibium carbonis TaxID=2495581 RepID=A0A429Z376_9HYPH|nr:Trm112 family protein [Aquibium carbonis]RST88153.1 Trm112 family protein [Aquibium carbonis]